MASRPFGFPPCATTGVGSLPFTVPAEALAAAREADIPYVPELLQLDPSEGLLQRITKGSEPILRFRLLLDRPRWVKAQLVGPTTLGTPDAKQLVMRTAVENVVLLARDGHQVIFFLDEPSLARHPTASPQGALLNREPNGDEEVLEAIRGAGALAGLHCCGNTDWSRVLGWPLDFIGFDARLSIDALTEDGAAFRRYVRAGGALAIGIIPTSGAPYVVRELVDAVEASLRASIHSAEECTALVARSLVTTACGLGLASAADARRINSELRSAQALLRERFGLAPEARA
ncbi:MAG: hypothetical protein JNM17_21970 [Archangium sp.]|nr:hypothetical protein [Archangium sp.]